MRELSRERPAPSLEERQDHLRLLLRLLFDHEERILAAVSSDFGNRAREETRLLEYLPLATGLRSAIKHLEEWMQPRSQDVHWAYMPGEATIVPQPLGVVGIISPWNYPLVLSLDPLAAALAAGNHVMLKLCEYAPATGALLAELLHRAFGDRVRVVLGGAETGAEFSRLPFDHLLFTGSTHVGRLVMRAAAENLTPVTLELGGKSPAIVAPDFDLDRAAELIAFGKLSNAGQTCVAPDYAMVPEGALESFIAAFKRRVRASYPTLEHNPQYTSIISDRHADRIRGLLSDAESKGATLIRIDPGHETEDPSLRKLRPTLVLDVTDDMEIAHTEIFGPVLPVFTYRTLNDAIAHVNARPRPLALYLFSDRRDTQDRVGERTVSGAFTINATMQHVGVDTLPFGGVGHSGMGAYHGVRGFETFSHLKPVFRTSRVNSLRLLLPPYGRRFEALVRLVIGKG
jgi:acyl-CoA reductase-like NAD-dependent aldehyde dehydrogenase